MLKKHWIYALTLVVFLLLLAKNPFSTRTLIPNFEPYPDTIHYVNPAINFLKSNGLQLYREGRALQTNVPPLYSIVLSPIFLLKNDARMFYFVNIFLALGSLTFFYFILSKLTTKNHKLITFTALFLYITNYFIYWYPSLAMAENLSLFLFMFGVYVLILPVSKKNSILSSLLSVAMYATKYANLPLTVFFLLSYFVKIVILLKGKHTKEKSRQLRYLFIFIGITLTVFFMYSYWEWSVKGSTLLSTLVNIVFPYKRSNAIDSGSWFSVQYVGIYLPQYIRSLFGDYRLRFLWDETPIFPIYVGSLGVCGLIFGIFQKKLRFLSISLSSILLSSILFMSTFYSIDMRYLYHAIPTVLIGFVMFWETICTKFEILNLNLQLNSKKKVTKLFKISKLFGVSNLVLSALGILCIFYLVTNALRLKAQIMLNLKYAETPWYYVSVVKSNDFFKSHTRMPYLITAMSPYYVDFFSNKKYELLPMSSSQDFFRSGAEKVWGKGSYDDLIKYYSVLLISKKEIYVLNYLGNDENVRRDLEKIKQSFKLSVVSEGCFGSCNIWKLSIK